MGTINITIEPIELVINGTSVFMQADPSATPDWATLLDTEVSYTDPKKRQTAHDAMTDALAAMASTPEDADLLRKLDLGTATLKTVAQAYVVEVTGFPTQPQSPSKKR